MCFFTSSFTSHAFLVSLNTDLFISCFLYVILSFIIKDTYTALSEFLVYIDSDFKHNVCKCCIYDVINLNNNCKHTVNQHYNCCV